MNKGVKNEYWYKELKSHVESVNAYSGLQKTILITGSHFYQTVTKVNDIVLKLWADRVNSILSENPNPKIQPINKSKITWILRQKSYRRYIDELLKNNSNDNKNSIIREG